VCFNAVDSQRANHGYRHLGKANEILNVVDERFRGRPPGFACQTVEGNPQLFEEALSFLKPRGSMVIAQRQPVAERFRGGQAWGRRFLSPSGSDFLSSRSRTFCAVRCDTLMAGI
jgi:hypothetical protein